MSIKSGYDSLPRGLVDPREMKVSMRLGGEFPNGKRIDLRYLIADIEYKDISEKLKKLNAGILSKMLLFTLRVMQ